MSKNTVAFIPHGGGPLPLLGDPQHHRLVHFLQSFSTKIAKPSAIIVLSAHWEEDVVCITGGARPSLIYDYAGFPDEAYQITYPAPGNPELAETIFQLYQANGMEARVENQRDWDHGLYVPLKLMYPDADIPCLQISLLKNLDAEKHIAVGRVLAELPPQNLLIIGSGFSFHNLRAFFGAKGVDDERNLAFEEWLSMVCTDYEMTEPQREALLVNWQAAPSARYCHPREEHLLPLHMCYGASQKPAKKIFDDEVLGKKTAGFIW